MLICCISACLYALAAGVDAHGTDGVIRISDTGIADRGEIRNGRALLGNPADSV